MARKYLRRKVDGSVAGSNDGTNSESEDFDPLDATEPTLHLSAEDLDENLDVVDPHQMEDDENYESYPDYENQEKTTEFQESTRPEKKDGTKVFIKSNETVDKQNINKTQEPTKQHDSDDDDDVNSPKTRIKKIKKLRENFDREIGVLKSFLEKSDNQDGFPIIQRSEIPESKTIELANEVTSMVENTTKQKIKVMGLQLENEAKQAQKLTERIQDTMHKIVAVNENIRKKLSNEVTDVVRDSGDRRLRIMTLQLENETKQAQKLNQKVQENMNMISQVELQIREQRDKLEREIEDKTEKLLQSERLSAIGELSARIAHDLRNPLSVIKASIDIVKIKQTDKSEIINRQFSMIERAISRMSHQIDDVLAFAKPISLRLESHSLLKTVKQSIENLKRSPKIVVNLPENDVEFVYDEEKIDIVLVNLMTNSVQELGDEGEITIKIREESDKFVVIEIVDSGKGIPEDILPNVFKPLVTTKQEGTGLGLASCENIIIKHGGTISVKNNPCTFTIKLPKPIENPPLK